MRVLLSTYGSRGDVEPMAALGVALRSLGAEVVVSAPADEEFQELLDRAGVALFPAFSPVRAWVSAALSSPVPVDLPRRAAEVMAAQFDAISAAADGCDLVLAGGLFSSVIAARAVAEKRNLHYIHAAYCPMMLPSEHHRPHAYRGHPPPPGLTDNRALWELDIHTMQALFGGGANALRASVGLEPVDNVRDHSFTDRPWLAADPVLSPWLPTALRDVVQTGAWILPDHRPLSAELEAFLDAGPPPVYVGFGSMPMQAARDAADHALQAARALGRRAILLQGWAQAGPVDDQPDCFVVGEVNQQALFRRVAAVVHHGGAGTTTAATRAGVPQVVVPQILDQPYWAGCVARLGIGVAHPASAPNLDSFTEALRAALQAETQARAADVGSRVRPDGALVAAKRILHHAV